MARSLSLTYTSLLNQLNINTNSKCKNGKLNGGQTKSMFIKLIFVIGIQCHIKKY